jgi:hypothetical protein
MKLGHVSRRNGKDRCGHLWSLFWEVVERLMMDEHGLGDGIARSHGLHLGFCYGSDALAFSGRLF